MEPHELALPILMPAATGARAIPILMRGGRRAKLTSFLPFQLCRMADGRTGSVTGSFLASTALSRFIRALHIFPIVTSTTTIVETQIRK